MRQIASTAVVALVVSTLTVTTMTVLAQEPQTVVPAAVSNINAHRVDGKHAVGAGASPADRAGKLVATNADGRLPSNILKPVWNLLQGVPADLADGQVGWSEVTNKPSGFADGSDNVGFFSNIQVTQTTPLAAGEEESWFTFGWPAGYHLDWEAVPITLGGSERLLLTKRLERAPDGTITYWLTVRNDGGTATTYRLRYVAFTTGVAAAVATASAERRIADVGIKLRKAR